MREHGDTADRAFRQQARAADRRAIGSLGKDVHAGGVVRVPLERRRNALLDHEYRLAHRAQCRFVIVPAGRAHAERRSAHA